MPLWMCATGFFLGVVALQILDHKIRHSGISEDTIRDHTFGILSIYH